MAGTSIGALVAAVFAAPHGQSLTYINATNSCADLSLSSVVEACAIEALGGIRAASSAGTTNDASASVNAVYSASALSESSKRISN